MVRRIGAPPADNPSQAHDLKLHFYQAWFVL
jgi:hypothetical protein